MFKGKGASQGLSGFRPMVGPVGLVGERRESMGKTVGNARALSTVLSGGPQGSRRSVGLSSTNPQDSSGVRHSASPLGAPLVPGAAAIVHQGAIGS